jgi:hypothetical protein
MHYVSMMMTVYNRNMFPSYILCYHYTRICHVRWVQSKKYTSVNILLGFLNYFETVSFAPTSSIITSAVTLRIRFILL